MKKLIIFLVMLALYCTKVNAQCTASFTYTLHGDTINFTNTSTSSYPVSYYWDIEFVNGCVSGSNFWTATPPANFTFPYAGKYTVCLYISDSVHSCYSSFCDTINVINAPHLGCNISFISYVDSLPLYNVYYNVLGGCNIVNFYWSFGDGTHSSLSNPTHTYASAGTYYVCLRTISNSNDTCTYCDSVRDIPCSSLLNVSFTNSITGGDTVAFTSNCSGSTSPHYYWDFGDGGYSNTLNVTHIYTYNSTYTVCLTYYQDSTCSRTYCDTVTITGGLSCAGANALFTLTPTSTPHVWDAINYSTGVAPISYTWTWGDSSSATYGATPSHTYTVAGWYTICLSIVDSNGCTSNYCQSDSLYKENSTNSVIMVNVKMPAGINNYNSSNEFYIYPNPATDNITIITSEQGKLEILNMEGQLMESIAVNGNKTSVDVSGFAKGVYFLKIEGTKINKVEKFIKE